MNQLFVRIVAWLAIPLVWLCLAIFAFDMHGPELLGLIIVTGIAGFALGYFINERRLATPGYHAPARLWWMVFLFGLVLPLIICGYWYFAGQEKREMAAPHVDDSMASTPPTTRTSDGRSVLVEDAVPKVNEIAREANATGAKQQAPISYAEGFEDARAYAPTKKLARANDEVPSALTRIGNNQWALRFRMPGPDLLETGLDFPFGRVYYISTVGTIPNLQVGWIDECGACKFVMPPSSVFSRDNPARYRMETVAQNARVVFSTTLVDDGKYEIRITESNVDIGPNEYAPGVPLGRNYRAQ